MSNEMHLIDRALSLKFDLYVVFVAPHWQKGGVHFFVKNNCF